MDQPAPRKPHRGIYLLPNLFTTGAMFAGFFAIVSAINARYIEAAIAVFVVAWIAQFIGHSKLLEGKRPSFFTDLRYLLIGPAWLTSKLMRRLDIEY